MSYILLRAINKNLCRKEGRYSTITKDIDKSYGNANSYFFNKSK